MAGGVRDGARAAPLPAGSAGERMRPARGGAQAPGESCACAVRGRAGGSRASARAGRGPANGRPRPAPPPRLSALSVLRRGRGGSGSVPSSPQGPSRV